MTDKRIRERLAGLVAVVIAAGVTAPAAISVPVGAAAATGAPTLVPVTGPSGTVTLVTGDRVTLGGAKGIDVTPSPGREHIAFSASKDERGHVSVVPRDAASLLSAGRLDSRLFDVTELINIGYDDASRPELPLLVDYAGRTPRTASAQVVRELSSVDAAVVHAQRSADFWSAARTQVDRIWLDGPVEASVDRSVAQIDAPAAWEAGHTGAGTTVAVLDSGIDVTHPSLDDAVTAEQNFTDSDTTDDRLGHGTHVASTITGDHARYRGVAPDAKLLNGKVLNDDGGGAESWIIAGMEWAAANGADVVNVSLSSQTRANGTDPMSLALNRITAETGVLFVVAAGNSGPNTQTIGSPGVADAALTVGAVDREDQLARFSSRGPRWQDDAIKPDITAPGVGIVAAKAKNGHLGEPVEDGYVALDGTSMAAPHVAGAAAVLVEQHPDWTPERLKAHLMGSAVPNDALSVFDQGAGRVDVAAAVTSTVTATPASISSGVAQWPHDDGESIANTVTYTNSGDQPVTVDLSVTATGPDGTPAPQGMFTVEPATLTVPAGGRSVATLTIDPALGGQDGIHTGVLVATGGAASVRTPVAVTREPESYDLKLTFIDHNGEPSTNHQFRFVDVVNRRAVTSEERTSTITVRAPRGTFYLNAHIETDLSEGKYLMTMFVEPAFSVTGDAELVFDARDGKQAGVQVDEPNAKAGRGMVQTKRLTDWGDTGNTWFVADFDSTFVRPAKTSAPGRFTYLTESELAEPDGTGTRPAFANSPYLYHVRWSEDGTVPADVMRHVPNEDLAMVRSSHAANTPGLMGVRNDMVVGRLPFTLTEYYTPGVEWFDSFSETADPKEGSSVNTLVQSDSRSYEKGKVTDVRWNVGVHGPAFPRNDLQPHAYASRGGDELLLSVPLATDQARGRQGWSPLAAGQSVLLRDGQEIARSDFPASLYVPELPAEEATYTYRTNADRSFSRLSTKISAEWTFRSGHVGGAKPKDLPLLVVRYAPKLDDDNATRPGQRFRFPVYVQRNGAEAPGQVNTPKVEVSYDDGTTWQRVRIDRKRDQWRATVDHPRGAEFVSLRSSVSDRDGNGATATVIRGYALK